MARNNDPYRVMSVRQTDGAEGRRRSHLRRDLAVRSGLAIRNRQQCFPYTALERCPTEMQVQVELGERAGEVGRELLHCRGEGPVIGLPAGSARFVGLVFHPEMFQTPVG